MKRSVAVIVFLCVICMSIQPASYGYAAELSRKLVFSAEGIDVYSACVDNGKCINQTIWIYENGELSEIVEKEHFSYLKEVPLSLVNRIPISFGSDPAIKNSIHYPCGRMEAHSLISTNRETIDLRKVNTLKGIILALVSALFEDPDALIISILATVAMEAVSSGASYMDVTEYKYFIYDYSTQISMNCFHAYYETYSYSSGNNKLIFDSGWNYNQVIL